MRDRVLCATVIVDRFKKPHLDLFASRINTKCQKDYSWHRDPEVFGVDAFTFSWISKFFSMHFRHLILKVLNKIVSDQACGILIVPCWKSQPWFPLWKSLLVEPLIILEPDNNLLLFPCRSIRHSLASNFRMMTGKLSGKPSLKPMFH